METYRKKSIRYHFLGHYVIQIISQFQDLMNYTFHGRLAKDLHFMFTMESGEMIDTIKVYMKRKEDEKTAITYRFKDINS